MSAVDPGAPPPDDRDVLEGTWWFPARRFLPGWGFPVRWQGWMVLAVYFTMLLGPAPLLHGRHMVLFLGYALCLTVLLGLVVAKKGEPLH